MDQIWILILPKYSQALRNQDELDEIWGFQKIESFFEKFGELPKCCNCMKNILLHSTQIVELTTIARIVVW